MTKINLVDELICFSLTRENSDYNSFLNHVDTKRLLKSVMRIYSTDKNSSTLREKISCAVCGFKQSAKKLGFDGYKNRKPCEVKPQNVTSKGKKKLNGAGSFSDFTWRAYDKYYKRNVTMILSGFIDGRMIFVLEFPFRNELFCNHLLKKLNKHLPDGDVVGKYIRSASFSFTHYQSDDITVSFVNKDLYKYKGKIVKSLYDFLDEHKKEYMYEGLGSFIPKETILGDILGED